MNEEEEILIAKLQGIELGAALAKKLHVDVYACAEGRHYWLNQAAAETCTLCPEAA